MSIIDLLVTEAELYAAVLSVQYMQLIWCLLLSLTLELELYMIIKVNDKVLLFWRKEVHQNKTIYFMGTTRSRNYYCFLEKQR